MTQRCVASTGSGAMISGHHVPTQSAAPTYAAARPVYIGLRLIRYGPLVTSVDTGWCGTTVVRLRRKVAAPDALSASPAIVRTAPTVFATGRSGKGNGSHFCSASVAESGAAKSSGGAGTRTAAPLSRVAAEVSELSLMVRPPWEYELSIRVQLVTPAAACATAAGRGGFSRLLDPTAGARRARPTLVPSQAHCQDPIRARAGLHDHADRCHREGEHSCSESLQPPRRRVFPRPHRRPSAERPNPRRLPYGPFGEKQRGRYVDSSEQVIRELT